MRICAGYTRIVLLTEAHAYKIARIRPLKLVLKLFAIICLPTHFYALHEKYDFRTSVALWKYLWAGWYANRAEVRLWRETRSQVYMPVLTQFLGGLIIVQPRARPVTFVDIQRSDLSRFLLSGDSELTAVHQYGHYAGSVRLLDYAHFGMQH